MNVLFLNVTNTWLQREPQHGFTLPDTTFPPLGMLYMSGMLESNGHTVKILDFQFEKHPFEAIQQRLANADVVGINADNNGHDVSQLVAAEVRRMDPTVPIVLGGAYCTLRHADALRYIPQANCCVVGEGEYAMLQIVEAVSSNKPLSDIPGVYYREETTIKTGKPPQVITDLDALPLPARHLVARYDYGKIGRTYLHRPKVTSISTSRGCNFHCRYCVRHVVKSFRQRSADSVAREILGLDSKYGSVMIVDDNFLADNRRAHAIMDQLIAGGSSIDLLISGTRVDTVNRALLTKMRRAGVTHIQFGIESASKRILDIYNKNITLEQVRHAVMMSHEEGFFITGSFMLGAPTETAEEMEQTTSFARSLPLDIVLFNVLHYYYGSDLWQEAVSEGNIKEDEHIVYADNARGLSAYSRADLEKRQSKALQRYYLRPSYVGREIVKAIRSRDWRLVKSWVGIL